jgi:hypothetical protein
MPSLRAISTSLQRPADEGAVGADGDKLPEPAIGERGDPETIRDVRRRDVDQPGIPLALEHGAPEDQERTERGEEEDGDPEEADIERPDPEIEEITADERPAPDAIFSFEAEHGHTSCLRIIG